MQTETNTVVVEASPHEKLFYEISCAKDEISLAIATMKIPSVARIGSPFYDELIRCAAARQISLEQ